MSDQDPVDKLLNQGSDGDRADYASGYGAPGHVQADKSVSITQTQDSAMEQANNWRGSK